MSVLTAATALAVGLVLLASGAEHVRAPRSTRAALRAHGVLPVPTHRALALLLGPVELVLALALLAGGVGLLAPLPTRVAALGAVLLCLGFTAYLLLALRRTTGADVPCGCGLGTTPLTHWSVVRAGLLAAFAVTALALPSGPWSSTSGAPVWAQGVVAACAGLALAVATAALPAARAVPARLTTLAGVAR